LPGVSGDVAALLESGERAGKIGTVVKRLSETMEARARRRAKLVEALTYPAFLSVVMAIALVVLAIVLVPALEPIFEGSAAQKPLTLRALSTLSALLTETPFVLPLAILTVLSPVLAVSKSARARSMVHGLLHSAPLVGSLLKNVLSARYLETLSLLLANGVPMTEGLQLAAAVTSEDRARLHLAAIGNRVSGGASLHDAMAASGLFDSTTISLVSIGEDANALPAVLGRAAVLQQERVSKRLDAMLKLLTPLLTITLGLLVGGLVVSVMTTILSVNDLALQ
jgi:general secretion pathway protein F